MTRRGDFVWDDAMQAWLCSWCGRPAIGKEPPDDCERCDETTKRAKRSLRGER